jgi:hypothetical protein
MDKMNWLRRKLIHLLRKYTTFGSDEVAENCPNDAAAGNPNRKAGVPRALTRAPSEKVGRSNEKLDIPANT